MTSRPSLLGVRFGIRQRKQVASHISSTQGSMLPKLRKSLQKQDAKRISPPSLSQKLPHAIEPPKAVIKALYSYIQSSAQELSFSKGDFFHVVGNENDSNW